MHRPDYKGGSIVNLMSSIIKSFGGRSRYPQLRSFKSVDMSNSKNIVLLVLDGLGYSFLKKHCRGSFLEGNLKSEMTSVFPSTTASAISSFITGVAPQQHAVTGWFMNLKELGCVTTILLFSPRFSTHDDIAASGYDIGQFIGAESISEKISAEKFLVTPKKIISSTFTKNHAAKTRMLPFATLGGMARQIKRAIVSSNRRKYIYAYWPALDSLMHEFGPYSSEALVHAYELDDELRRLCRNLDGTGTKLIITADHGLIETGKDDVVYLEDHPKLKECLVLPLCGEPRVAYCYVRSSKAEQFESYIKDRLDWCCWMHKSEDLVKKGFFGLYAPDSRLFDRIGDYTLIMKDNYIMKDSLPPYKKHYDKGNHGGTSMEEMSVPLIVIDL